MILSDLSQDYLYVCERLKPCSTYFGKCHEIIDTYFSSITKNVDQYFKQPSPNELHKTNLITKLSNLYKNIYNETTELITVSFSFYNALTELKSYKSKNNLLNIEIQDFIITGEQVMNVTNNIVRAQLSGMKEQMLLSDLINLLQKLTQEYDFFITIYSHIKYIDQILMTKIPDEVVNDPNYNSIELISYKENMTLEEYSLSLKQLSSFFTQIELLKKNEDNNPKIYIRKLESGSLRLIFGSNTFELDSISDIIRAITDGIRSFRLTTVEKQKLAEENRSKKLENDAKELCIVNSQIKSICEIMGLSNDNPEDKEKIQKLCLPMVRYINNNPIGKINNYYYDITTDMKLLEDFYFDTNNS